MCHAPRPGLVLSQAPKQAPEPVAPALSACLFFGLNNVYYQHFGRIGHSKSFAADQYFTVANSCGDVVLVSRFSSVNSGNKGSLQEHLVDQVGLQSNPLYPVSHCNNVDLLKFEGYSARKILAANRPVSCLWRHPIVQPIPRPRDSLGLYFSINLLHLGESETVFCH